MSTVIIAACWPLQMPPSPKSVLVSLADNANDSGYCWPSIASICLRTCLCKSTVIEAIKWLEQAGLVIADRSNGRKTTYTIIPKQPDLFDAPGATPVQQAHRSSTYTGSPAGPNRSSSRTKPVQQPDTNRQEPPRTNKQHQRVERAADDAGRGRRLPDDWRPGPELRAWADLTHPDVDLATAAAEFADYWRAIPGARGRKLDWDATFRNRVRELAARARPRASAESAAARGRRLATEAQTLSPDRLMVP